MSVNLKYLEDNVFIGLRYKNIKVHLSNIAFEVKDDNNSIVIIGSDALAPFMNIEVNNDARNRVELSFDIPYSLVVSEENISKFKVPEIDYASLGIDFPTIFSLGLIVEITPAGFTYRLAWMDDRLGMINHFFGSSFGFVKIDS
jgi:hypothetical protein